MMTIRGLKILGLICFLAMLLPVYGQKKESSTTETKITLGIPHSPWLRLLWKDSEDLVEKNEDGTIKSIRTFGHSWSWTIELVSWSSVCLITGIALTETARLLQSKVVGPTAGAGQPSSAPDPS